MSDVILSDLTNATTVSNGTGVFDKLMKSVNLHIEDQYNKNRITGPDYATVYLGAIQSVIAQSVQFLIQDKTLEDKVATATKQREVMESQKLLYDRQKEAFDDNKYQKLLEAQLNYNGMVFQDADTPDVLDVALEQKVNDVFNKLTLGDPITAMPEV